MKKIIFCASMMLASVCAQAQLKVNENGNVSIQTSETALSPLSIGYAGRTDFSAAIAGVNGAIHCRRMGTTTTVSWSNPWTYAIQGANVPNSAYFYVGVRGCANASSALGQGRAFGVIGEAGNTSSGYNYGVYGQLNGTKNGAAVYGTCSTSISSVPGRYAGYFDGDVKVTGSIYGTVLTTSATANAVSAQTVLAANAASSSATPTITSKLAQLSPVQYSLNLPVMTTSVDGDTATTVPTMSTMEIQHFEKPHYGLVASELKEIMPELVYENQNGDLCINYIEMIPLLVESIKELKAEITTLQTGNNGSAVVMSRAIGDSNEGEVEKEDALVIPMLKQNNPNPFTENTVIEYSLPETVQTANIYIYDMNGAQIMQIPVTDRGLSSTTVNGGQLNAGMYIYSLIADGKVIDTKRMILTK